MFIFNELFTTGVNDNFLELTTWAVSINQWRSNDAYMSQ